MPNQEMLLELTEFYLKSLVAETLPSRETDFDTSIPFGDLGIDSFRVLKIIKALEADFGVLPKTLLFENFTIDALVSYFVDKHKKTLQEKFLKGLSFVHPATAEVTVAQVNVPAASTSFQSLSPEDLCLVASDMQLEERTSAVSRRQPIHMLEKDLPRYPELESLARGLYERHKNEGCVSRGTRNIAPNLFIGSERKGYFNYSRSNNAVLVYAYTGSDDYFPELAKEMHRFCVDKNFQLNIFVDKAIDSIDGVPFSATPFGALQRVLNIQSFTLEGGAMRRLRYQVSKFEKAGVCRTHEYKCGTDKAIDDQIAVIIDKWCETKTMVNPLVHIVKEEILAGTLHPQHRIFLTYLDDVLWNVILISGMCHELNGYLMDLEFYPKDMPQGGLEYAITNIIKTLAGEGCDMLSLGGTYGCRLSSSDVTDPEVDRILDDLHKQNIFNDESNLQFKNKFRPENRTIYICRPVGCGNADSVIDIIMMIADPAKAQSSDEENHNVVEVMRPMMGGHADGERTAARNTLIDGEERSRILLEFGFNPLNLPSDQVEFDLKTDSWAQLDAPFITRQIKHLRANLQEQADLNEGLRAIFPFQYFVLTDAGRTADHVFCKAWSKKGIVLQNLLFPTCIFHQIDKGLTPCELPHQEAFRLDSSEVFKGNLLWDALQEQVECRSADIAYVCIEVGNNATGGHPVSIQHLRQVKELLSKHSVPLVIDATRVLDNAQFLIQQDSGEHAGKTIWAVAREILSHADVVIGSLAKNFCVNKGGIIATNDESLLRKCQDVIQQEGGGLNVIDKRLIALSLSDLKLIETLVLRRMEAVKVVWEALAAHRVPVVRPMGGHCVLIDVKRVAEFGCFENPVASFVAWLYLNTGIRAGSHSVGMQKGSDLNGLVRLAMPLGLKREQAEEIASRLVCLFADKKNIPELALADTATEYFGDIHVKYELVCYRNPSGVALSAQAVESISVAVDRSPLAAPTLPQISVSSLVSASVAVPTIGVSSCVRSMEIAVIGMAGRYPKAVNLLEFWDNLRKGRDCIEYIPDERMDRRVENALTRRYRGAFIDGVDKFDSLFFNISPREAEALDPQERLFLEVAWEAIEDAGYYPEILSGENAPRNIGVFVGAVWAMYQIVGVEERLAGNDVSPNSFLWSIANRVSYWMNLTGPSLTVDTACSSSLTALYLACEAIRNGDCSGAIVGGVNLDLHQHKFDINWAGGALSSDGVCRSFGAGANGYVAGEGIGAIFIKPLDKALEDRDNIYGVIKSSTANHGGRTSGYTVPNPKAQGDLIAVALERAQVDARSIGYVEAHGTGTELGDPVEISGLASAFEKYGAGKQSCPVGSVKTNIGHLEAAAGIVGISKVLLQMRFRQLVPSLHSAELNEHIDFDNSPFYVQQQLEKWQERMVDGHTVPLRAGVSSFGAGGANAHIIIENFSSPVVEEPIPDAGHVFPLSARNDEQLREMVRRLRAYLDLDFIEHRLNDIAFTLQNGRKSFEHRLAIVAATKESLSEKLDAFLSGKNGADTLVGHAKNAEGITRMLSRTEKEQFISLLARNRDPHKLAQLWIDGLLSDCRGFLATGGRRTSLPTYPFADKRHWVGAGHVGTRTISVQAARSSVHPMIDSNESTFQRQLFRKRFHAQEFFLGDHVVSGRPTLPGTAYLDLARKAGELAAGRKVCKIKNVTWVSPLTAETGVPTEALIELKPGPDSALFEVFNLSTSGGRTLYAQGRVVYAEEGIAESEPEYIDVTAIRARTTETIAGSEAYPLFESFGLQYGPSFQLLQEVYKNKKEVLGLLKLPEARIGDFEQFVLHPCILDASMQAGVIGQLGGASGEMKVPYAIGEIEFLHPLTSTCYSYVTTATTDRLVSSGVSREDVVIADESGKVLVRIRESVGVPLASIHGDPRPVRETALRESRMTTAREEEFPKLYYTPTWEVSLLTETQCDVNTLLLFDVDEVLYKACLSKHRKVVLVLPGDSFADLGDQVYVINPSRREDYIRLFNVFGQDRGALAKICYAWSEFAVLQDQDALASALQKGVHSFFLLCQALMEVRNLWAKVQLLYLYFAHRDIPQPHNEAIIGFARSFHLETPQIDCKVLEIRQEAPQTRGMPGEIADWILAELHADAQNRGAVRYENRTRYTRTLKTLAPAELGGKNIPGIVLKQRGVYLITGGVGGLGLIFAEYLAKECQARLVLTGRSRLSAEREGKLEKLRSMGAEVLYVEADVSKREDVQNLLRETASRFGGLHGIVHSAGVLRDSFLSKKSLEDMTAVYAPKVYGAFHLDWLTRNEPLDFFVMFSSLASFGNIGQCDYAFANHYLDSFAAEREVRRAKGQRSGKTLSLNWSLWAGGGMRMDEATESFFKKQLGIKPLSREFGLEAFTRGLVAAHHQLAVLEAIQAKIEVAWGLTATTRQEITVNGLGEDFSVAVMQYLSQAVMELLKLGAGDLSVDGVLTDLGFDSVGLMGFANMINEMYGLDINPTLFFEYPSIRAIAGALTSEHGEAVCKRHGSVWVAAEMQTRQATETGPILVDGATGAHSVIDKSGQSPAVIRHGDFLRANRFVDMPIAIVGIAGVMPQSENIEEFWDGLKNARNMVTEIPRDRWIWEDYDGDPIREVNKSNSRWGGFMKEIDKFDPLFFGITPREAEMMDPQQRIFIETVWSAIEDSGHKVSDLSGTKTGLFVGVSAKDYIDVLAENDATLDGFSASGNSHSILANRVSFLFNLRGPSAPIDTACSSSLIALHRAIESIHTGSSEMAIVGGVQVMLTPVGHVSLSSAGMLSVDGKCKTFDKDANGYVRGEGAGAIFIKPLDQAERDGNPIYAVIKATAENHGGRVTMLTAPNPKAQAELLLEAYEKAQIDPTTIGFIECHGTGTSLGDPIEIQALKKSFSDLYKKYNKAPPTVPHCGLSSVKTNIGHLEPAAGIASLLKVLLSIKHKQIPALLHFEALNSYIDLSNSPFYVVDKTTAWEVMSKDDGTSIPRRAGVSSFGWGGANAHVVLEEYVPPVRQPTGAIPGPRIVVLSAKNEIRLKAYARLLLAHIQKHAVDLVELAYTLQIGRDALEVRLALIVDSVAELADKLRAYIDGKPIEEGVYQRRIDRHKRNAQGLSVIEPEKGQEVRESDIDDWLAREDFNALAEAWIGGIEVSWSKLYPVGDGKFKPGRVSLPTYPFARDRHWIAANTHGKNVQMAATASVLHPFLHHNVSTLERQRYSTSFSGKEFFLIDHQQTLPAFAYLEMAREAVVRSRSVPQDVDAIEICDFEWTPAIAVTGRNPVAIDLSEGRSGQVEYEIHSVREDDGRDSRKIVHCRGRARFDIRPPLMKFDLRQLKMMMTGGKLAEDRLDSILKYLNPRRGALMRAITEIHQGDQQLLARFDLPSIPGNAEQEYVLHPSVMDSALQSAFVLVSGFDSELLELPPPTRLGVLQIMSPCNEKIHYTWARYSRGSKPGDETMRLDLDVMDGNGIVCARLKSLTIDTPRAAFVDKAQGEDFGVLLDSIYRFEIPDSDNTLVETVKNEFERILEEIL